MRAKVLKGEFHTCEGCKENDRGLLHPGSLREIKGWKDLDGDWLDDAEDYEDLEAFLESQGLDEADVEEAMYTECAESCDSDDGWEMDNLDRVYVCGVCGTQYIKIETAGDCCDTEEDADARQAP